MTVQTELRRVVQTGNGATATFYFNAPVLGLDDLDIYTVTTAGVQTLQTRGGAGTFDYTMTINSSTKYATVTLNNNLTNGFKVVMLRSTAITQGVDYVEGDPFLAETHEGALDRLTLIATQLQEQLDRSVKVVETSTTTGIKISELVADKILVVNSAADGLSMGPTLAQVDTVATNIATVQTVATNIASVNTVASDLNEAVSEINTVAVNITNVNTVGTDISNVNTVATDIANINTVASDLNEAVSEINTVGTNIANVNTVGTDITNVNTVASGISNVNTVATNIANVNTNATNIASINTNATNIVAIQNASTNATNAASSASNAATSETNSAASAILANDWATKTSGAVAGGEFSAKYHAQAAATSASNASSSASTATTQATNAATSATGSANSATSAAASAASAAALLDNFDDRYLGAKASDPALDNDGNALVTGALYFNTTDGVMKVYTASGWIAASSASVATLATFEFVATAGQTVFTGADANSATLSYVAPALIVTLNGVRLRPGDDYTATNGTSITLISAAALNDELVVDAFGSFLVANTYTIAQTDAGFVDQTSNIGAANLPSGTTAERPGSPVNGQIRYNTTLSKVEAYQNGEWVTYAVPYAIDYLIVAGGGAGGGSPSSNMTGGGGGAGGYIAGTTNAIGSSAIVIGAGGTITSFDRGNSGNNSSFLGLTAIGGGGGGGGVGANGTAPGLSGGSGGGSAGWYTGTISGGSGTAGQGNAGGTGGGDRHAAGGGGAGAAGGNGNGSNPSSSVGGVGLNWQSLGTFYAGGGGGGSYDFSTAVAGAAGGNGGGGQGGGSTGSAMIQPQAGAGGQGGGGGGAGAFYPPDPGNRNGAAGGGGVVIIRYAGSQKGTGGTYSSSGGYSYHTFTSSGTFTA